MRLRVRARARARVKSEKSARCIYVPSKGSPNPNPRLRGLGLGCAANSARNGSSGVRVLYTGDFSREEDRHLCGAETPAETPHVLICEATYGVALHMKRELREQLFCSKIHEIVARGGRCLIPVFALGRSQELRLILAPTPTLALALTLTPTRSCCSS